MGIYFIVLLLLIVGNAAIDWYRIERLKKSFTKSMYRKKTAIRASIMLVNTFIVIVTGEVKFSIWSVVVLVAMQSSTFWWLFDITLNLFRGKDWDYIGSTATSDVLFTNEGSLQLMFKFLFLFLSYGMAILILL